MQGMAFDTLSSPNCWRVATQCYHGGDVPLSWADQSEMEISVLRSEQSEPGKVEVEHDSRPEQVVDLAPFP